MLFSRANVISFALSLLVSITFQRTAFGWEREREKKVEKISTTNILINSSFHAARSVRANNAHAHVTESGQLVHDTMKIFGMRLFNQIAVSQLHSFNPNQTAAKPRIQHSVSGSGSSTQHCRTIIDLLMKFILFDEFDGILSIEPQGMRTRFQIWICKTSEEKKSIDEFCLQNKSITIRCETTDVRI